jgi:molybdate transport system substrate-binding protein
MHCASKSIVSPWFRRWREASRRRAPRALVVLFLAGAAGVAAAADLTVSAAASLTNAYQEIGTAFEAANPGTKVQFNFAA